MSESVIERRFPRVNVGEDHTCRFKFAERSLSGLTITNISAGGCCLKIPAAQAESMEKGALATMMYLVHPRIPSVPMQASICWMLGKQPGKTEGFVLVGFEFVNASPQFQETLEKYVDELLTDH